MSNKFSYVLHKALRINGLSPSDFAKKLQKSPSQISRYLHDKAIPKRQTVRDINKVLTKTKLVELDTGWELIENTEAIRAINAVDSVGEAVASYTAGQPEPLDPLEEIELAVRLIQKAVSDLREERDEDEGD